MNKYPMWKYAIIAIALVASLLYAAPNLFGEVPAVQLSGMRANAKVDDALKGTVDEALKAANIVPVKEELADGSLRLTFNDPDTQLKARDIAQAKAGDSYVAALNLVPNTPKWMQA